MVIVAKLLPDNTYIISIFPEFMRGQMLWNLYCGWGGGVNSRDLN